MEKLSYLIAQLDVLSIQVQLHHRHTDHWIVFRMPTEASKWFERLHDAQVCDRHWPFGVFSSSSALRPVLLQLLGSLLGFISWLFSLTSCFAVRVWEWPRLTVPTPGKTVHVDSRIVGDIRAGHFRYVDNVRHNFEGVKIGLDGSCIVLKRDAWCVLGSWGIWARQYVQWVVERSTESIFRRRRGYVQILASCIVSRVKQASQIVGIRWASVVPSGVVGGWGSTTCMQVRRWDCMCLVFRHFGVSGVPFRRILRGATVRHKVWRINLAYLGKQVNPPTVYPRNMKFWPSSLLCLVLHCLLTQSTSGNLTVMAPDRL